MQCLSATPCFAVFTQIGIPDDTQEAIYRVLSAILHLQNVDDTQPLQAFQGLHASDMGLHFQCIHGCMHSLSF